jgi:hypothetical protein
LANSFFDLDMQHILPAAVPFVAVLIWLGYVLANKKLKSKKMDKEEKYLLAELVLAKEELALLQKQVVEAQKNNDLGEVRELYKKKCL